MQRRRRAPGKRPRAQKTARRTESAPLLRIEQPLTDAINYVQALYLMGFGLISHREAGGDAIVALAHETGKRLETMKEIWNEALGERQRSRRLKRRGAS